MLFYYILSPSDQGSNSSSGIAEIGKSRAESVDHPL